MKSLPKLIRSFWLVALLALFGLCSTTITPGMTVPAIAYDEGALPTIAYDVPSLSVFDYDVAPALPENEGERRGAETSGVFAGFSSFLAAKSADTIAEGLRISPYRVTGPGETFIRYESGNPAFTKITPSGVKPQTFAAPASDGLIPVADRVSVYNLPSPHIPRPNAITLTPPPGTPIIGPRPVMGGTGNEVIFPMGY